MEYILHHKKTSISLGLIFLLVLFFTYRSATKKDLIPNVRVEEKTITQEITVSGTVKSKQSVQLAFEKVGRIRSINVDVGEVASRGSVLMSLENGVETSAVDDAEAKLVSKKARYDELKAGGRPEEIRIKESDVAKAKSDLATYYATTPTIIQDAFNKADNAVHRQAEILFSNSFTQNPQLSFSSSDQQAVIDAQNGRLTIESVLGKFKVLSQNETLSNEEKELALADTRKYLLSVNDFLIKTNRALNAAITLSDTALSTNKDALSTALTNVNTSLSNVTDHIQAISTQKITVETAENQLELAKVGATEETLAVALADIQSADANVKNARALLLKTYIISPISGVVTQQDAKVGEIASANTIIVSVQSGHFNVEAFIPEVDVAKLALENTAVITLDAYGSGEAFNAHVVKIDPAETVIDGVPTYKATLEFDKDDTRIRSGMTANTTIITATRENVLTVPQRAVYENGGKKFVRVITGSTEPVEREVVTGIRGSTGEIEIISGLTKDDFVATTGLIK
ncbi:MAG: efflux RND transporter periplasmic adaptor subunit [Candidatus Taylorbacteria bacterium]|nr:efflux RND transporter periplasmic adaptor subunit [Candidatus Taylorbacteria bacterium]